LGKLHGLVAGEFVAMLPGIAPAWTAPLEIQPGLWQDTEITEINGKKEPPKAPTDCAKPDDAKDPVKLIKESMKDQQQKCQRLDVRQKGNAILFDMNCGDPKQGAIELSIVYTINSPQSTSNTAKSIMTMMGQKIVSSVATELNWRAATCKKVKCR
jgi:hypothetical protein